MKQNKIEIIDYEVKKSSAGKRYWRFETSIGWMSCFNEKEATIVITYVGKKVGVEWKESPNPNDEDHPYKNIQKVLPDFEGEELEAPEDPNTLTSKDAVKPGISVKSTFNQASMYASYAKDIFCELWKEGSTQTESVMADSINLVKQAKEAFESK